MWEFSITRNVLKFEIPTVNSSTARFIELELNSKWLEFNFELIILVYK